MPVSILVTQLTDTWGCCNIKMSYQYRNSRCKNKIIPQELTNLTNPAMHLSHISQCTTLEQKCAYFCSKVVHCGICDRHVQCGICKFGLLFGNYFHIKHMMHLISTEDNKNKYWLFVSLEFPINHPNTLWSWDNMAATCRWKFKGIVGRLSYNYTEKSNSGKTASLHWNANQAETIW